MKKSVRIGNSSGFWGDDPKALYRQVDGGQLDYVTSDYLAEVSMSILQKQQDRDPEKGYVEDFIFHLLSTAILLKEKKVRLVTNAGGNNPLACGRRVLQELKKLGIEMSVAVVEGDNVLKQAVELYPDQESFSNFENQQEFVDVVAKVKSANAYVGIPPILEALKSGAQIIITGRATDSSIVMAPIVHEYGWRLNDWNKLGSAMLAAHIIECGGQSTGGNFTDWMLIDKWDNFGFPIIEMFEDGTFYVTKHENTGGMVTVNTIKEQLVYEIADPKRYFSPDVIADLTHLEIEQLDDNLVKVSGGRGVAPTDKLKVSMAYEAGFQAKGNIIISGPDAVRKAQKFKEIFWSRFDVEFEKTNTQLIGYNSCHLNLIEIENSNEILLQFDAFDIDRSKLDLFSKLMASLILTGPPGVAVTGGRPKIQRIMAYWPTFINKQHVPMRYKLLEQNGNVIDEKYISLVSGFEVKEPNESDHQLSAKGENILEKEGWLKCKILKLCLARSGDKGNAVNVGLIARNSDIYKFLDKYLTAAVIKGWFGELALGTVKRYRVENLLAFNFFLEEALDGGGTRSMRIDAQGKTFASALLNQEIKVPEELLK